MSTFRHLFVPHHTNNQKAKLLHSSSLAILVALFAVFQVALGYFTYKYPQILGYASQIPPAEIVRLTNLERQKSGLVPVKLDEKLSRAASKKAADMFARGYWAHVSPSGTQPWFFITDSGYSYRYAGENLARDFSDSQSVVTAWMNSPTHKENLLSSRYEDIGVAVVDGTLEGKDTTLVVQMFGTKLASSPAVGGSSSSIAVKAAASQQKVQEASVSPERAQEEGVPMAGVTLVADSQPAELSPISAFELTKYAGMALLILLVLVLTVDIIIVKKKRIVRWTARSFAHLIFVGVVLAAVVLILRGQII